MAKRTTKKSTEPGAPSASSQIPEANPALPDPWETVAASVPKLPPDSEVTAHAAPAAKMKPTLPTGIYDFDPDEVQRSTASLLPPAMALTRPARSRLNVLATDLMGTCAMSNKLGTLEPEKVFVTFSDDRCWCYMMPVDKEAAKGLKVDYRRKTAAINLWKPLQRSVEKGYSETYAVEMTETPITIHGVKGFALYFNLANPDKQPVQEREEAAPSTAASTKRRATKQSSTPASTRSEAMAAGDPAALAEQVNRLNQAIDERDEQLEERETQIEELEKRLAAYEAKFGKL